MEHIYTYTQTHSASILICRPAGGGRRAAGPRAAERPPGRGRDGLALGGAAVARSRLYRNEILQVNMRWTALAQIYKMHSFEPFSWDPFSKLIFLFETR